MLAELLANRPPLVVEAAIAAGLTGLVLWAVVRIVKYFSRPGRDEVSPDHGRYRGLRSTSSLLRLAGWLAIIASMLGVAFVVGDLARQAPTSFRAPRAEDWIVLSLSGLAFTWGLIALAFAELLHVMVDIALNTRQLPDVAEHTDFFYKRFNQPTVREVEGRREPPPLKPERTFGDWPIGPVTKRSP
jgi:formate-dependent nitrite reductase membrane component NrfD